MDALAPGLRPELLRSLLTTLPLTGAVPATAVAHVCGALEAHALLAESAPACAAAVDAFVERVLALTSSPQEESRAAAATLLAAVLRDCALRRFVAHLGAAGARLLLLLRPAEPERVRVAACCALRAAVGRASAAAEAAPAVRREVAGLLSKALPLLLLDAGAPQARAGSPLSAATLQLVHVVAAGGCASVLRPHAEAAEAAAAAALAACAGSVWAGPVLAALPRVAGDAAAWSSHARRILLAAHAALDAALRGLEPPAAGAVARGALDAPGEPPARPLDPTAGEQAAAEATQRARAWLGVAAALLETPFPVAVPFPTVALYALAARVLAADGRPVAAVPGTAPQRPSPAVLLALPALHASALDMLAAALRSGRRAGMLQVAAPVAELLRTALRAGAATPAAAAGGAGDAGDAVPTCPSLRASVYAATACFLHVLGGSFAAALGHDVVAVCARDLAVPHDGAHAALSELGAPRAGGKKRKKREDAQQLAADELGAAPAKRPASASRAALGLDGASGAAGAAVRTAALRALEALCSVAGGVLAERTRADLDAAVAAAAAAYVAPAGLDVQCAVAAAERSAAYACLLASVLAPRPRRAPHLPLALALFRRGADDPSTAEQCSRALLALEAIIHPVAPPRAQPRDMAEPSQQQQPQHWRDDGRAAAQVLTFGAAQLGAVPPPFVLGSVPVVQAAGTAASAPAAALPTAIATAGLPSSAAATASAVVAPPATQPVAAASQAGASTRAVPAPVAAPRPPPSVAVLPSAAPPAPGAAVAGRSVQPARAAAARGAFDDVLSSDSEGPLPDIVSGEDESEDDI